MASDKVDPAAGAPQRLGETVARPDAEAQISGLIFAVLLIDGTQRVFEANHAAENLIGMSVSRIKGETLNDLLGPLDPRVIERLSSPDAALVARDIVVRTRAGKVHVNLTASPIAGEDGWRVVTLSEGAHEETARESDPGATIAAPSVLAHEIKNPLAAIRGAAQLAERKLAGPDRKLARMITAEVDRIAGLVDRMQQLGSTHRDPPAPCNPHEAIRAAVATVRAANADGVEFTEEFDPSLPPVLANRQALEQVLINLLSNARDAASAKGEGAKVTVRTRYTSGLVFSAVRRGGPVGLPIEISVVDNGGGIDPALRDHIFEPFVTSKKSGQGLGLALVRKLVRDMQGSISHERDARAGLTLFRVHLPKADSPAMGATA